MSAEGKAIKEDYAWQAKAQWRQPPLAEPFGMRVRYFHKVKRKQDLDNYFKLLDALNLLCYEDDNLIHEMLVTKHWDKDRPRIEIEFHELGVLTSAHP